MAKKYTRTIPESNEMMKTIYYENELKDEFSAAQIRAKKIDASYRYLRETPRDKVLHGLFYWGLAKPLGWLFLKLRFRQSFVGKEKLKSLPKDQPCFLYGNHTNAAMDPFVPNMLFWGRDLRIIVHPNNVSMPVFGHVTPYLGALPLPDDREAMDHFVEALHKTIRDDKSVIIYPEAHIWPYYTKIRPFKDSSFRYPVEENVPVYCFVNTWHRCLLGLRVKTYVEGPFFPDPNLHPKQVRAKLRDQVYEAMCRLSEKNTYERIRYVKREENQL